MKKTVSVNIKGMNFLIEEDAYELLQTYMNRLTHSLRNEKGSKEIIEDIEFRVAELCSGHLNDKKQVIEKEDIEQIIKTLGEPEEYVEGNEEFQQEEKTFTQQNQTSSKGDKRLYRDIDNAKIAGVCSGLANYLHVDVAIIRVIFLITFLFAGFGFPLYVILWIVLPKAASTIDRLRMQGKPITVGSVKEEVEMAAERIKEESTSFAYKLRKDGQIGQRINYIIRLIKSVIGIGVIGFGLAVSCLLISLLVGIQIIPLERDSGFLSITDFGELVLSNDSDIFWMWTAVLTTGFSVILFSFILGSKLIFNLKNKWIGMSLLSLFITSVIGIILSIFIGVKTGQEMIHEGQSEGLVGTVNSTELIVKPHFNKSKKLNNYDIKSDGTLGFFSIEKNKITQTGILFEYKISKDSLFHVYRNFSANSSTHSKATKKAENIKHLISFENNILDLSTNYSYPKSDKLRDQRVLIIIEIPEGKSVLIGNQKIRLNPTRFNEKMIDYHYTESGEIYGNGEYEHYADVDFDLNF